MSGRGFGRDGNRGHGRGHHHQRGRGHHSGDRQNYQGNHCYLENI